MRSIVAQVLGIIVLGSLIGAADAFQFRPISTKREVPPAPEIPDRKGQPKAPDPARPAQGQGAEHSTPKTPTDDPAAHVGATPAPTQTPATGAFKPTPQDQMPPGQITLETAKQMFDAQAAIFVDARKMELYEQAHVAGAYKIELHDFDQGDPQILMLIPRDSQVVIYCTGGNCDESEKVAQMMQGSGYTKCYVMHDGLPGWQAMGWPVEQGRGMMP